MPDRPDFDRDELEAGRAAGGRRRVGRLDLGAARGPDAAPPLQEWLGPEILGDLGAYRMEDMQLVEKLVWELPVNWKVVVDGFNETYHAAGLHNVPASDAKDGRQSTFFVFERHAMMVVPYKGVLAELLETPRPPGHRDLPLHRLPEPGLQQQPAAHPAVPPGSPGGGPDPV